MSPPTTHHVTQQTDQRNHRRWVCVCGWATPWSLWTRPEDGPAAVRHLAEHHQTSVNETLTANREEDT